MVAAVRQQVTVKPGGVIEVQSPELEPGTRAEVIVLLEGTPGGTGNTEPLASFIAAAKGSFSSVQEVDSFIRSERDEWDR